MREYAARRDWQVGAEIKEVGSGALQRPKREELLATVRRRELDAIVVWRLDRWGRSLADLVLTLKELAELGVGFVSLTEAFDMTTPTGRALAGMLAVFAEFEHEILRERIKAGIAQARAKGITLGRPLSAAKKIAEVRRLYRKERLTKSEIARRLGIGRTSVRRMLEGV
jgi:putative DNA-invertase from lambdoid prophage Rac